MCGMYNENSQSSGPDTLHWGKIEKGREDLLNVRRETISQRTWLLSVIDKIGIILSKPVFFLFFLLVHVIWILINLPVYPWWAPWDPYPFTFLATVASAEAPFISILILMHQLRNSRIDDLRAEIELQVSLHVERQTSMSIRLLRELQEELKVPTRQEKDLLERMEVFLDPQEVMQLTRERMKEAEGVDPARTA